MEFTKKEKKAVLQFIFAGTQSNHITLNQTLISKITSALNMSSQTEINELRNMSDLNIDEMFDIFRFGGSFEKIEIFQKLTHEIGL
jgi:hypothetical protein